MKHRFIRIAIGLIGLALVAMSWVLSTPLLWGLPVLAPMYGLFRFTLTSLGLEVVISIFVLGLVVLLYALLPVLHKQAIPQTAVRN